MHTWDVISGRCLHLWNIIFKKQRGDIGDWKPSVASIVQCYFFFSQAIVDFYLDWIVNGVSTPPRGEENVFKCRQAFNLLSPRWTLKYKIQFCPMTHWQFTPLYRLNSILFYIMLVFIASRWYFLLLETTISSVKIKQTIHVKCDIGSSMKQWIALKGNGIIKLCCRLKSTRERKRESNGVHLLESHYGGMLCQTSDSTVTGGRIRHTCECVGSCGPRTHPSSPTTSHSPAVGKDFLCPVRKTTLHL